MSGPMLGPLWGANGGRTGEGGGDGSLPAGGEDFKNWWRVGPDRCFVPLGLKRRP